MKTFSDNAGRTWTIAISVDAVKRVRDLVKVDLLSIIEGKLIDELTSDPVLLCDVLYAVCKPEADAQKISDSDFGKGMAGDAIENATGALLDDLIDFFPKARRQVLSRATEKLKSLQKVVTDRAIERIDSLTLDSASTLPASSNLSTVAPASPDSNRAA